MKVVLCSEIAGRTSVNAVLALHAGLSFPSEVRNRPDQRRSPLGRAPDAHLAKDRVWKERSRQHGVIALPANEGERRLPF
jgi:hypothetical protein